MRRDEDKMRGREGGGRRGAELYQNRFWIMVQQVDVPCLSISIKVVLHFNYIARGDVFLVRRFLLEMRVVRSSRCHCCSPLGCRNSRQERQPDQWTHADLKYSEERRQQTLKCGRRRIDEEHRRLRVRPRSPLLFLRAARRFPAVLERINRRTGTFPLRHTGVYSRSFVPFSSGRSGIVLGSSGRGKVTPLRRSPCSFQLC